MGGAILRRDDVTIPDLAIPLAPSTAASVTFFSDGTQFYPPIFDDMVDAPGKFSAEQEAYIIEK